MSQSKNTLIDYLIIFLFAAVITCMFIAVSTLFFGRQNILQDSALPSALIMIALITFLARSKPQEID